MKVPKPRKVSSGNYFIQMRLGGESITVTEPTERACIRSAQIIKANYLAGLKTLSRSKTSLTLRKAIDNYIKERENILSPSTIRGYRTIQNSRFLRYLDRDVSKINWQKMCNDEAGLCSAKTLKNAWRFVCSVLRKSGVEPPDITMPQSEPSEKPFLAPDDIKKFVKAVHGEPCEIPALLALSSLRRSEICALTWDNVKSDHIIVKGAAVLDENNNVIYKKENKNETSARKVPILIPELKNALDAVEEKEGLVWKGSLNTIYKQVNRVCRKNNLPLVGVHGLRHSFASLAYHLQIPEQIAMEIGGWSDVGTMRKIYTHIAKQDMERYKTKLSDFFKNAN